MNTGYVADLAIVFAVAVAVAFLFARWKLPTITGFLLAGVLVGPGGFGLVPDGHRIESLAEIGVVLLLFTVGLELSVDHLRRIWRWVVVGGFLQVALTTVATWGVARLVGLEDGSGVLFGFMVAMSSTAIVLRALDARGETDSPHGKLVVGVLIFQDLCVVPMMLALPLLAGKSGAGPAELARVMAVAVVVVALTLVLGRYVVPVVLRRIAAAGRRDVLLLAVVLVSMLTVWASAAAGLSLALGAFLAGVVVAGTPFGRQALSDALPLRDIFVSLFFVSIGLLLDVPTVTSRPLAVLGLAAGILVLKQLLAGAAALVMRLPLRVAVLSGTALAQVGEFSFVLLSAGAGLGLVPEAAGRVFLAAAVVTMLVTPLAIALAPRFAAGAMRFGRVAEALGAQPLDEAPSPDHHWYGHVVVAGYGTGGRLLAASLGRLGVPHVVLDLNAEAMREASAAGVRAFYADITSAEVLHRAGLKRASALVLLLSDPTAVRRAVEVARGVAPDTPIVARCRYAGEEAGLRALGATRVVAAEVESSVEVLAALLRLRGAPRNVIDEQIDETRAAAGPVERRLTVPPAGWRDLGDLLREFRVESWLLQPGHWAVGRDLVEVALRTATGASVVAIRRRGALQPNPASDLVFEAGDIVHMLGTPEQVALSGPYLETGPKA